MTVMTTVMSRICAMQGFGLDMAAMTGTTLYDCTNTQSNPPEQQGELCLLMQAAHQMSLYSCRRRLSDKGVAQLQSVCAVLTLWFV